MEEKVLQTIKEYNLIEDGDTVVAGVSGGPDSMAMLYILIKIKKYINFNICVAHVNHGVRGEDADKDEEFVKEICEDLNLKFFNKKVNMNKYAKANNMTAEEAGRKLRYGFFREVLKKYGRGKIAVAHNKNDQAETVIMRFIRGTGIDGLEGIAYKRGPIIRPLLDISRMDIEKYIKKHNIDTRLDKTNLKPIYNRNKIRLELIPYIEENFNPNIIDTLVRISNLVSTDSDYLNMVGQKKYKHIVKDRKKHSIILDSKKFNHLHESIKQRVVRSSLEEIHGHLQGFTEAHISNIIELFSQGVTGKTIHLIHNTLARVSYENLIIEKRHTLEARNFSYKLKIDGDTTIKDLGYNIKCKVLPRNKCKIDFGDRFKKYFDYDKITDCLYIRNRRKGDRFNPLGMKGSKKLKDFFIDEKIPRKKRDSIPLIVDGEDIVWILGYRISDKYKITNNTKNIIVIEIQKI